MKKNKSKYINEELIFEINEIKNLTDKYKIEFIDSYIERGYPKIKMIDLLYDDRNKYYYEKRKVNTFEKKEKIKISDKKIQYLMFRYIMKEERYIGHKKIYKKLQLKGYDIKQTKAYYLYRDAGLKEFQNNKIKFQNQIKKSTATNINSEWEFDIREIYLKEQDKYIYLIIYCDTFDKTILTYKLLGDKDIVTQHKKIEEVCLNMLQNTLKDNGIYNENNHNHLKIYTRVKKEFLNDRFQNVCMDKGIEHHIIDTSKERAFNYINGLYKKMDKCIQVNKVKSLKEINSRLEHLVKVHNTKISKTTQNMPRNKFRKNAVKKIQTHSTIKSILNRFDSTM